VLDAVYGPAAASKTSLCVSLQRSQVSVTRGQAAQWTVSAWTEDGNVPAATVRLTASPSSQVPEFSFGCGNYDGSASCNLEGVYSASAHREYLARITVPASDTTVSSVRLTAIASAANLVKEPSVSVTVTVDNAAASSSSSPSQGSDGQPSSSESPLPVGSLPAVGGDGSSSSLSPGGNASGLFPTINPSSVPSPGAALNASERAVADSVSLPIGTPVIDAQLVGLGALGLAFLLAATRLSVRRRPSLVAAGVGTVPAAGTPPTAAATAAAEAAAAETPTRIDSPEESESFDPDQDELDAGHQPYDEDESHHEDELYDEDEPYDEFGSLSSEPPTRPDASIYDEDE
jgi:hypothetical protein